MICIKGNDAGAGIYSVPNRSRIQIVARGAEHEGAFKRILIELFACSDGRFPSRVRDRTMACGKRPATGQLSPLWEILDDLRQHYPEQIASVGIGGCPIAIS